jgi:AcrR family transcriptional regulator
MTKRDDFRERLVTTAREIYSRYGYKQTSMEEVAEAMGKGKSTLYYYFDSKESLYEAVIDKEWTILRDAIYKAVSEKDDPIEKLKAYVTVRMLTFQSIVNFYEAIESEMLGNLFFINQIRDKFDKEEMQMVEALLNEGVKRKLFLIENTELASIAIVTVMRGLEMPLVRFNSQHMFDERIDNLLKIMFYGIVKR